ncbi:MAG TPA: hypothetical protein VNO24_06395 [Blastocatellia bacterium]|nr:hypothetical protein [Blastocatellia bacterium]
MFSSERTVKLLMLTVVCTMSALTLSSRCNAQSFQDPPAQEALEKVAHTTAVRIARRNLENYKGQNGILSMKTLVLGGEFRVTTVIPFRGNIADYNKLEITRPVSLVGGALNEEVSNHQVAKIKSQFESRKIFEDVTVIDSYNPELYIVNQKSSHREDANTNSSEGDALEAPIRSAEDMEARDRQRAREQELEQRSTRTLVTVIEVLDYAKGSRLKQALPLDLGKSILTVRLRYYDKMTGQEIGRQIISGRSDGSSLLGPLSPRDALSGVADGLVDQVTRRVAASVR